MTRKILLINGHPDASAQRLAAGLCEAYATGAKRNGHEVRRLDVGTLNFPPVVTGNELSVTPPDSIQQVQDSILWADHLVVVFPLWLSAPPALLKSLFEQVCRYGFWFDEKHKGLLGGRSVRIVVTTTVPAMVFHMIFSSGVRAMRRGIFWVGGFKPIRTTVLSSVLTAQHQRWLAKLEALGARGD